MKKSFEHLPKDERKKILLICDDIRTHSGVATVAREIVIHTSSHFNWVQMAGSITHPEKGQRFDLSADTNKLLSIDDSSVILYPTDGYGDPNFLRQLIDLEKPDAILLITDPRYFEYIFQMENELRKNIPIAYLNIWDDYPTPLYNKAFYEACDLLMGISKQTVNINKLVLGDKSNDKLIKYVPHGLSTDLFFPMTEFPKEFNEFKNNLFGGKEFEFVTFFNSRNIRRKAIPDTLLSFKFFLDKLPREEAEKCAILLHTEEISEHGTDLPAIVELLFEEYPNNVFFTRGKFAPEQMNWLYNMADVQILLSSNEGWGLSLTEALLTGTPIIANTTGGMQDQMRFEDETGNWIEFDSEFPSNHLGTYKTSGEWSFPVFPTNRSIQGSPKTPYIWDDRCSAEDAADQLMNVYLLGNDERKRVGNSGRKWALGSEAGFTSTHQSERIVDAFNQLFATWTPRNKYEFINTSKIKNKVVPHKLLY